MSRLESADVVVVTPAYIPVGDIRIEYGGSELFLHKLLNESVLDGRSVSVLVPHRGEADRIVEGDRDGVHVISCCLERAMEILGKIKPRFFVSQLLMHSFAWPLGLVLRDSPAPVVASIIDEYSLEDLERTRPDRIIYCLKYLRDFYRNSGFSGSVIYPIMSESVVYRNSFTRAVDGCLTLVNPTVLKGAKLFRSLSRLRPNHSFRAIRGTYGEELAGLRESGIQIAPFTNDMDRDVWSRTSLLLMPSEVEAFGMTAFEATQRGIPVIASDLPGLKESLGPGALFLPYNDENAWVKALDEMNDKRRYNRLSLEGLRHSADMTATTPSKQWRDMVRSLC